MGKEHYTFGDTDAAGARLRRLAETYEPETRDLLLRSGVRGPRLAIDLGCGPGWSTRLVHRVLCPGRTIGLDASERYITDARQIHGQGIQFLVHDVTRSPFPADGPDVMFCRFLLTHLRSPREVLATWAGIAAPGGMLFIHETETLESDHPALRRYYELVGQLQGRYGQELHVGAMLEECIAGSGWQVVESERHVLRKPAMRMAQLHVANLRTWRHDEYARQNFDPNEIDRLEATLAAIAGGNTDGGVVLNAARQIIARHA